MGNLWKYCKGKPFLTDAWDIPEFIDANVSDSVNFNKKRTGKTGDDCTKDIELMATLKYVSNFWKNLEMQLINCKINLILTWSANCVIKSGTTDQATTIPITDTKLDAPVVILSTQDNEKCKIQMQAVKISF